MAAEINYSPTEKECLSLVHATKKFRHYLLGNTTKVIVQSDPLRYLLTHLDLMGRAGRWAVLLQEFDILIVN